MNLDAKQYRFSVKITKNTKGYNYNMTINGNTYQEIEIDMEELKQRIEQKIKKWKNSEK